MKIMGLMEIIPGLSFWSQILFSDIVWEKFERFAVGFSHTRKWKKQKKEEEEEEEERENSIKTVLV